MEVSARFTGPAKVRPPLTAAERRYLWLEPFRPPLNWRVRKRLTQLVAGLGSDVQLLDIGGRESPYTVGVPAQVTVTDVPQSTDVQRALRLGWTDTIRTRMEKGRSNISHLVLDDMTRSSLPTGEFDCAVAVEVIEHVDEDERFVAEVARVLKPGGAVLLTTPNGDHVPNSNPDHRRHYSRVQLASLLSRHFSEVSVEYAIAGGVSRRLGQISWRRWPFLVPTSMAANVLNALLSARDLRNVAHGTHHLFAIARNG